MKKKLTFGRRAARYLSSCTSGQ